MQKAILTVSFGTSFQQARERSLDQIERAVAQARPDCLVAQAFTSNVVRRVLRQRDGIQVDSVEEALGRLREQGICQVVILPTLLVPGQEYDKLCSQAEAFRAVFSSIQIAAPLLDGEQALEEVLALLMEERQSEEEALIVMGHGTEHRANIIYWQAQELLKKQKNCWIATVETVATIHEVIRQVQQAGCRRAALVPLMVAAGNHVTSGMAGNQPDSWKAKLQKAGLEVRLVQKGLGEREAIRWMYLQRLQAAESKLTVF